MILIKRAALYIIIFILLNITVSADDGIITVLLPKSTTETTTETTTTSMEKPAVSAPKLYPVSVTENNVKGRREIIKTYELSPNEKPSDIPRDSFERDGFLYEIADVTKKDNIKTEQKNHTETIKIDSETKDFDSILKHLPSSKEYNNGGFTGTLMLDIGSITVEQAGTRSVAYTISETREYPYLSSNDSSLVPKTIVERYGRTLTLSGVTWRTQSSTAIDYDSIPDSYTAVATYTGTAYNTVVTGYNVTAQYSGIVSKKVTGKTVYTALFIGIKIIPSTVETTEAVPETTEIPVEIMTTETTELATESTAEMETEIIMEIPILSTETETTAETVTAQEIPPKSEPYNLILILIIIVIVETAGLIGCFAYFYTKTRRK